MLFRSFSLKSSGSSFAWPSNLSVTSWFDKSVLIVRPGQATPAFLQLLMFLQFILHFLQPSSLQSLEYIQPVIYSPSLYSFILRNRFIYSYLLQGGHVFALFVCLLAGLRKNY